MLRAHRGLALHGPMHMLRQSIAVSVACSTSHNQPWAGGLHGLQFATCLVEVLEEGTAKKRHSQVCARQHTTARKQCQSLRVKSDQQSSPMNTVIRLPLPSSTSSSICIMPSFPLLTTVAGQRQGFGRGAGIPMAVCVLRKLMTRSAMRRAAVRTFVHAALPVLAELKVGRGEAAAWQRSQ